VFDLRYSSISANAIRRRAWYFVARRFE